MVNATSLGNKANAVVSYSYDLNEAQQLNAAEFKQHYGRKITFETFFFYGMLFSAF